IFKRASGVIGPIVDPLIAPCSCAAGAAAVCSAWDVRPTTISPAARANRNTAIENFFDMVPPLRTIGDSGSGSRARSFQFIGPIVLLQTLPCHLHSPGTVHSRQRFAQTLLALGMWQT